MTEQSFVQRRNNTWNEFSFLVRGNKRDLKKGAASFVNSFREITQDLNTAKANGFDPIIIERLNTLVNEGNQILYKHQTWPLKTFLNFLLNTFPQKVRSQWKGILAASLLFYGVSVFFTILCVFYPDITKELIPERTLSSVKEMYNPDSEYYLQPRKITNDADMFGFYIYNNISIAFRTFAGGIFAGIGSLFILLLNAVFLGVIDGFIINEGYIRTFFGFVIAHSSFELTAIIFSGYAGMLLGYRFFITNGLTRGASVKRAGEDALPIIAGSTIMLVIAAAIEAFWSSKHLLPFWFRIGSGASLWILLLIYFLFAGRNSEAANRNSDGEKK
ncbi:MAG: stage II sporulation protein M [Treponema sp.]|nr:stage II sporulation protein M [Treponema sp.]